MDLTEEIRKIAEGIPAGRKYEYRFDFGLIRRSIEAKTVEAGYRFVYSL